MNYLWIIAKIGIIYFVLILILRVLGKREVGQLSIFDLVILLIIADIASLGIDNDDFFIASFLCLFTLSVLQKLLSFLLMKFAKLRNICDGNPTIIVYEGVLNFKNMKKELYTVDDLVCQMRNEHIMDISEIKLAVLETSGALSLFKKNGNKQLIMPIILSGEFVDENLECLKLSTEKIEEVLQRNHLTLKQILYASICEKEITYYLSNKKAKQIRGYKLYLS